MKIGDSAGVHNDKYRAMLNPIPIAHHILVLRYEIKNNLYQLQDGCFLTIYNCYLQTQELKRIIGQMTYVH